MKFYSSSFKIEDRLVSLCWDSPLFTGKIKHTTQAHENIQSFFQVGAFITISKHVKHYNLIEISDALMSF